MNVITINNTTQTTRPLKTVLNAILVIAVAFTLLFTVTPHVYATNGSESGKGTNLENGGGDLGSSDGDTGKGTPKYKEGSKRWVKKGNQITFTGSQLDRDYLLVPDGSWHYIIQERWLQCAGSSTNKLVGMRFSDEIRQEFRHGNWVDMTPAEYRLRNVQCLYETVSVEQVQCIVDTTVSFNMNTPTQATLVNPKKISTSYASNKTLANCRASQSIKWNEAINITAYGRYDSLAQTRLETMRVTTTRNQLDSSQNSTKVETLPGVTTRNYRTYAQLTCAGARTGTSQSAVYHGNPSFTHTDCGPQQETVTPIYQCTGLDNPTFDGVAGNRHVMYRDGEDHSIAWTAPGIVGTNLVTVGNSASQQVRLLRTGTPWHPASEGKSVELKHSSGAKLASTGKNTGWATSRLRDPWTLNAYWESAKNDPLVITPQSQWSATIRVSGVRITSIDPMSGRVTTQIVAGNALPATATCTGTPVTVEVVRATSR